jgi:ribA/ribD-fused uncharacterized protein
MTTIKQFTGEHRFLSNFFPSPISDGRFTWPTVEHRFQALKTLDQVDQAAIRVADTPGKAKRMGRKVTIREDWEQIKLDVMGESLEMKFGQNPDLAALLIATGGATLEEGNTWGDTFWGIDLRTGKGENWLGTLLMVERAFLLTAKRRAFLLAAKRGS